MEQFMSDPINRESYRITTDLQYTLSGINVDYVDVCKKLKTIRCLLSNDDDRFVEPLINCSMHSSIIMARGVIIENAEAVEESLRCLLPLCKLEKNLMYIAEDMISRGAHVYCIHALRRYSGRKNIKFQAVELMSLLIDTCFAPDAAVFPISILETQRSVVLQDILIHGGVSVMSGLLVQFSATDVNVISLYRLLLCIQFVLFHGMTDVTLKVASTDNFKLIEQFLRILISDFNANFVSEESDISTTFSFDVDTKNMISQVLICFIGSHKTVIDTICYMLSDYFPNSGQADREPGAPSVFAGLYAAVLDLPGPTISNIPVTVLERAATYTNEQIAKLVRYGSTSAEAVADLQNFQTVIDDIAINLRKAEQQKIIGKFLQNVMKGRVKSSSSNIMTDSQLGAANLPCPRVELAHSTAIFDAKNNNLVNDVKNATYLATNDSLSREFWLQGSIPSIFQPDIEPMVKRLQTNPLGRRVDPFRASISMESGKHALPLVGEDDLDPTRPHSPLEQYISPTLELMLKANPKLLVKPRLGSADNTGSPNKNASDMVQIGDVDQPARVTPLDMIKQSPYLSKFSLDNIKLREEKKKQAAALKKKKTKKPKPMAKLLLPQVPLAETKRARMLNKSTFNKGLFDVQAAAVRLFEPVIVDTKDRPSSRSGRSHSSSGVHSPGKSQSSKKSKSPERTVNVGNRATDDNICPLDKLTYAERLQVMIMQVQKENTKIQETDDARESTQRQRRKERRTVIKATTRDLVTGFIRDGTAAVIKLKTEQKAAERVIGWGKEELVRRDEKVEKICSELVNAVFQEVEADSWVLNAQAEEEVRMLQLQAEEQIHAIHDVGLSAVNDIMTSAKVDVALLDGQKDARTIHDVGLSAVNDIMTSAKVDVTLLDGQKDARTIHDVGLCAVNDIMTSAKVDVALLDGQKDARTIHEVGVRVVSSAVQEATNSARISSAGSSRHRSPDRSPEATFFY